MDATNKPKLDPEVKVELLIKLAFGISIEDLAKEYDLTRAKIINLRKNNYLMYNDFLEHWKIDKDVAVLGLVPKYERALSIVKKFYKAKIKIISVSNILFNNCPCSINQIVDMADEILKKDDINNFKTMSINMKNNY
jgi:hypothetical protein